jgi:hypothetical protein
VKVERYLNKRGIQVTFKYQSIHKLDITVKARRDIGTCGLNLPQQTELLKLTFVSVMQ